MSYRDDLDAAQSRIQSLERDLAESKKDASTALARRGDARLELSAGQESAQRWLGARTRLSGERIVEGEIDDDTYAELVECITEGFDCSGRSSVVPNRLDWTSATSTQNGTGVQISISITHNKGRTRIKGEVRLGALAGGIFGGVGGGVGGGGIMAPGALFFVNPILGAAAVAAWLGGAYWACRKIYKRSVTKREIRLEAVLDRLEDIVRKAPKRDADATGDPPA